jgi:hypothetical protein
MRHTNRPRKIVNKNRPSPLVMVLWLRMAIGRSTTESAPITARSRWPVRGDLDWTNNAHHPAYEQQVEDVRAYDVADRDVRITAARSKDAGGEFG